MADSCFQIQILNPPDTVPDKFLTGGSLWIDGQGEITTIQNRLELTNFDKLKVDAILALTISQSVPAKMLIHDKWCPGTLLSTQKPYEVRIWKDCEPQKQRFLYCIGKDDQACTYTVQASYDRSHWAILFAECKLCDIFKNEITDIVNGGTFEFCERISFGLNVLGQGDPDLWQQGINSYYYNDGDDGYVFLPVWYGGQYFSGQHLHPEDIFRPWFNFLHILRKGACHCGGWRIKAPIFEIDLFRRALVYILSENYGNQYLTNTYGSVQAGLDAHVWKAILTPGTLLFDNLGLGINCIVFDQIISDPFNVVDSVFSFGGLQPLHTTFNLYNDMLIGACVKFRMILTENDYSGTIEVGLFSAGDSTLVPYTVPGTNNTVNIPVNPPIELGSITESVSTDEDGNLIVEGEIEVDCIKMRKVNPFYSGHIYVCIKATPDETPAPSVPDMVIEYFEIWSKPKRHIYRQGDSINFCDAVSCEKSFLDYLKGAIHMINGIAVEDIATKTLCIYPPKNVEMPDGTMIEGYDKNEVVEFKEFVKCLSHVARSDTETIDRYCRLGFAKSTDPNIKNLTDGDEQIHDYLYDNGDQYQNSEVTDKRNPFFEPTAITRVDGVTCNGTGLFLPNLTDNTNGEISYKIGCRILLGDVSNQLNGGMVTQISYCEVVNGVSQTSKVDTFLQGYHSKDLLQHIMATGTATELEILSYNVEDNFADNQNDFFNLFYRRGLLAGIGADRHSFQYFNCGGILIDFRKRARMIYEGKRYLLNIEENQSEGCSGCGTLIGYEESSIDQACFEDEEFTLNCAGNSAFLTCEFDKETGCYTFTVNANMQSPIANIIFEVEMEDGLGGWTTPVPQAGNTLTTFELCNINKDHRVRAQVIPDSIEDEEPCPPFYTNYQVKDPCPNYPIVECVDIVEKTDPCENCFKLKSTGNVCSKIKSITGTLEVLGYDLELLQTVPISFGPIDDIDPLDWTSDEICSMGPCFIIRDLLIEWQDGCDPYEVPEIRKVFRDCCCDLSGKCVDCEYSFDQLCGYKVEWYQICEKNDHNNGVLQLGLNDEFMITEELQTVDDELKDFIKCNYSFWGGYKTKKFHPIDKVWYIAILSKQNEPKDENGDILDPCPCILWAYYHAPFNPGGIQGEHEIPTLEPREQGNA